MAECRYNMDLPRSLKYAHSFPWAFSIEFLVVLCRPKTVANNVELFRPHCIDIGA